MYNPPKKNIALNIDELEMLIEAITNLVDEQFKDSETTLILRTYTKLDIALSNLMKQVAKDESM